MQSVMGRVMVTFDLDLDNNFEPLLHLFEMGNIKADDSNKAESDFWNTFSDIAKLR